MNQCDEHELRIAHLEKQLESLLKSLANISPVQEVEVDVATTQHISLATKHAVLSGKRLNEGDLVWVKAQKDPSENGIYRLEKGKLVFQSEA